MYTFWPREVRVGGLGGALSSYRVAFWLKLSILNLIRSTVSWESLISEFKDICSPNLRSNAFHFKIWIDCCPPPFPSTGERSYNLILQNVIAALYYLWLCPWIYMYITSLAIKLYGLLHNILSFIFIEGSMFQINGHLCSTFLLYATWSIISMI